MTRVKENKARERRVEIEVVVDAYNASERAMGWSYYLEERLKVPFLFQRGELKISLCKGRLRGIF